MPAHKRSNNTAAARAARTAAIKQRQQHLQQPAGRHGWWPWLARYAVTERGVRYNVRHQAMSWFYHTPGGEEKFRHCLNSILLTWPEFVLSMAPGAEGVEWPKIEPSTKVNPWMARLLRAFTNEKYAVRQGDSVFRFVSLTGCAAAGKTHVAGLYALAWWMMDPDNSIAVLTSTTKDMIRNRVWSVIRHYATTATDFETGEPIELGRLVDSQMKLVSPSGNAKCSISAYAVAHGETLKAIDNLKGLHAPRMLVIIDEANGTPEAIFNVLPNYRKGCKDLTVIVIGNPVSRMDPHGRACKPLEGWALASNDRITEWQTEGVPDWQCERGLCLRFDGRDSPNVIYKENRFPYLYLRENWLTAKAKFKEHGGTFSFYAFDRGMWSPEGQMQTIFNEQLFLRCGALDGSHYTFLSERTRVAFLDTAFGGDACILVFGELGDVEGGLKALQITDWLEVPIDPTATNTDIDYQIARRVMQELVVRQVKPYCFGLDATGIGRGVAAIMSAEWSNAVHCVIFSSGTTDRPSSQNDGRPAREVYDRYVTELWFAVRETLEAGQVKGFSQESVIQFCSRLYEMSGKKYKLETKEDMKLRVRYSPDHADAVVGLVEVARRVGLEVMTKGALKAATAWHREAVQQQDLVQPDVHEASGWAEQEVWDAPAVSVQGGWD